MAERSKQLIDFSSDDRQQVAVQPGGELVLKGIAFDDVSVDIIDTDVILSIPDTGEQLILLGLAIYLFDEEEVPLISFDGEFVSPNLLLSKVGEIGNLTMQEFVAVSSLLGEDFEKQEEEDESDSEAAPEVLAAITQAIDAMNQAQQTVVKEVKSSKDEGKYDRKAVDEEGDSFQVAQNTARPESPALAAAGEAPLAPAAEVLFDIFLLQPSRLEFVDTVDGIDSRQIRGGGGSEEAGFNPANDAQFSTEVLNYGTATDDLNIQTDNPDLFDQNTMSRVIEMTPTFPAGFAVTEVRLSGFPDGYEIEGATKVGDDWILASPELNDRGSLRVNLVYAVPSDESFSVDFSVSSEFQVGTLDEEGLALPTPPETLMVSEDSREFVVREVFSPADLNFINSEGQEVWVLAVNPNPNRVFSGSGNDQITGSVGVDFVQGGDGNDIIDGGAGNDVLNGEGGDDLLLHGEGLDRFSGGSGIDTLDYSSVTAPVDADLSVLVDGFANVTVDSGGPGSEIDEVIDIENVITGSGNDSLVGDMEDNRLTSGAGNDRLVGGGGNDVLDGGDDRDIADYSASTGPIIGNLALAIDNVYIDDSNIDTLVNIEHVIGSEFDDDMTGGSADDTFEGGAGNDRLSGGAGSDTLDGGEGDRDVADFSGADTGVRVDLGGATDIDGYVIATQGADADRLRNIEDLIGSEHDDELRGNELDQFITGGEGDDSIDGADGADTLDGGSGQDQIVGGSGDDTFLHSDGNDQLDGGEDQDTIDFSLSDSVTRIDATLSGEVDALISITGGDDLLVRNIENVVGTSGNDRLQGDSNDNVLDGRDGDDVLIGAAGDDTLIGGAGRDSADYSVATVGVNIDLSAGEVTNDGFGGRDAIDGIEDLTGSDYADLLSGDEQDNVLSGGLGNDVLIGRAGDDLLSGGDGQDAASYEFAGSAVSVDLAATEPTLDGEGGRDTFDSIESAIGSAFNDSLLGDDGDNLLSGLGGNDTLNGREGDDVLMGGAGDDRLLPSAGSDSHDGGVGNDVLDYSGFTDATDIRVTLSGDSYAQLTVSGSDNDQVRNVETIIGTSGDDVLGGDFLSNTLRGEDGDDVISGGAGSDQLFGGEGDDQLRFDDLAADGITLSLTTNTAAYTVDGSVDTFSGFERYATTNQNDFILTSEGLDTVEGLSGDDHFFSSSGNDQLFGGLGQDVVDYSADTTIDHIEATLDEGNTITITVVGGDDDQVTSVESVIGSQGDDLLIGDTQNNELSGSAGDDILDGAEGDDTLRGDDGQDRFLGGLGADTYEGGAGQDVIDYSGAAGGISVDLALNTALNDGYGSQDSIQAVESIIGTSDNDIISGDGKTNVLTGSDGDDVIRGGIGSDTLDGGAGSFDEVHFDDLSNYGITLDLQAGTAFYPGDASTDQLIGFERYFATGQDDVIRGSSLADVVFGAAGNDLFNASLGLDLLDGGNDSDSLDYSGLADATSVNVTLDGDRTVVVAVGGVGNQSITRIENITGTDGADVLGGDSLSNTLVAGAGNDRVFGGAGSDILEGGTGSDELRFDELGAIGITLTLGEGIGTAFYAADSSTDTFSGFERYLTTRQDDVVRTSNAGDEVYTLDGDDLINASLGSDTIDGGLGSDKIDYSGLVGVTSIQVSLDNATPVEVAVAGAGNDTISNIENVTGTDGDDVISGDVQQNTLEGLSGSDTLSGGAGDDILLGGQGDDRLRGGDGNDSLFGEQGRDTASYSDAVGGVAVDLSAGIASNDGFGGTDVLNSIENIEGSIHADLLRGSGSGNEISGDDGDDIVYGGQGSDNLSGGNHVVGDTLRFDDLTGGGIQLDLGLSTATFDGDLSVDTFSGFERYIATEQSDVLSGSIVSDVVNTLGGNDSLNASAGSDTLDGGAGVDTLDYSGLPGVTGISAILNGSSAATVNVTGGDNDVISNIENLRGSSGDDVLGGDANANRLEGLDGADQFFASAGVDTLVGGAGVDTVDYSSFVSASSIAVTLQGSTPSTVLITGSDNDTISEIENIVGTAGNDTITGDAQDNTLEGRDGSDTLDGGLGTDTLLGGDGSDLINASEGADTTDGGAGVDTVNYSGLASGQSVLVSLSGSSDATVLISAGLNQTIRNVENIVGTDEDDQIAGDSLQNHLQTRGGDDLIGASSGSDVLDGGTGVDTVDYSVLSGVQRISVTLDGNNSTTVQVSGGADDQIVNVENIVGTDGNDTLVGDYQNNHLEGRLGHDHLVGAEGNDVLDGGGGAFVDSVSYIDAATGVTVDLATGIASEDGFGSVDTLIDIEQLTGSNEADELLIGSTTQAIDAAGGDDQITAGLGAVNIDGGTGSDTVDYSSLAATNAVSVELDGLNSVTLSVNGSTNQTLSAVENLIGSQGDDVLTGDNNNNTLDGGVGNDTLQGLGGNDTLIGGLGVDKADYSQAGSGVNVNLQSDSATDDGDGGSDTLSDIENLAGSNFDDVIIGDSNDNTLEGNAGADTLRGGAGSDVLDGGSGTDVADYSSALAAVSVDLANNTASADGDGSSDSLLDIENVQGSSHSDILLGDANSNTLDGGDGDDLLRGGGGFDTLIGNAGTGDTADYSLASNQVLVNLSTNSATSDGDGSFDTLSGIENVVGSSSNDQLLGDSGINHLQGGDGADTLVGGASNDILDGGTGLSDTVDYSAAPDSINIDLQAGFASADGYLSADTVINVENVIGSVHDDAIIGSTLSNIIESGSGDDQLTASAGNDSLDGGVGSDTLDYSSLSGVMGITTTLNGASDVTVTVNGGDNDIISNIENLVGSDGNDVVGGDTNANRLEGLDGSDRFIASAGADTLIGGDGSDTVDYSTFAAASSIAVTLQGSAQSAVIVTGSDNDVLSTIENVVGTTGNDTLGGDSEDNILDGRAGSDTLDGGLGADTLLGGDGSDLILASAGADTIDGGSGEDTADFSGLASGQSIDLTLNGASDSSVLIGAGTNQTIRNVENIIGTGEADQITGDLLQNNLQALGGDDLLGASGGSDTLDGGAGVDTLDYSLLSGVQRITVTLQGSTTTSVQVSGGTDDQILNIENVIGTAGNDVLTGDSQDNHLEGRLGNDLLVGAAGNDLLDGGDGAFVDSVSYIDAAAGVTVDLSTGIASEDGYGSVDTLIDIEQLTGSGHADNLTAATDTQRIDSEGGDDAIILGLGSIDVDGGSGSDTANYSALSASNSISVELDGLNSVTLAINGSSSHTLTSIENIVGTQGDDVLTGDGNDNTLDGGIGDDTLQGLGGDDTLIGGAGVDKADYSQSGAGVNVDLEANSADDDGEGGTDTLSGIENLAGSNFDDVLRGNGSDNTLEGNAGADTLIGGAGLDTLDGGTGRDVVDYSGVSNAVAVDLANSIATQDGDGSSDTLLRIEDVLGSDQDDTLLGDGNNNTLTGGQGDDLLRGAGGFDTIIGGDGTADTADYSQAAREVVVDLGNNTASNDGDGSFDSLSGIENVEGSVNNDHLTGDVSANRLHGGDGSDILIGAGGNDYLDGGAGLSDSVDYSAAPNAINVDLDAQVATADGYLAVDTITNVENVSGSANNDVIAGSALANTLEGGTGDDVLKGRGGVDTLDGDAGIDTADYSDAMAGVTANLTSNTTTDDGDGSTDTLVAIENLTGSDFEDNLSGNFQDNRLDGGLGDDVLSGAAGQDTLIGGAGNNTADYSAASAGINVNLTAGQASLDGDGSSDTLQQIQNVTGTVFDDTLVGDTEDNHLIGGNRDDSLQGRAGVDILDGGAGVDTIDYSLAANAIVVDLSNNISSDDGDGASDTLVLIENVSGSAGADTITGDANDNVLFGDAGDDLLVGGAGNDRLDGGTDNDTASYSAAAAGVTASLSAGLSSNDGDGGSDVLIATENLIGSAFDDVLEGDAGSNQLFGGDGDDEISGYSGNDSIDGGSGINTANYTAATAAVTVDLSLQSATDDGYGFVDTLQNIQNVAGSVHNDTIAGDGSDNQLLGGDGDDSLSASAGNDVLDGADGNDTADYSSLTGIGGVSIALNGAIDVVADVQGGDDDTLRGIENIVGSEGSDTLAGDSSINEISGGANDDVISGGSGSDVLDGGAHIVGDELRFDELNAVGVGLDLVSGTATFAADGSTDLFTNFEFYVLTQQADSIIGSSAADSVSSMGGDDSFLASQGADLLDGGFGSDTVDYSSLAGVSAVNIALSGSTASTAQVVGGTDDTLVSIENIVATAGDDNLVGDDEDNTFDALGGNDTLDGGAGRDQLSGGAGDDTFIASDGENTYNGGADSDTVDYSSLAGINSITAALAGTSTTSISVSGGSNDFAVNIENIIGSAGDDSLTGDGFANRLEGSDGDDLLAGLGGADILIGGDGIDTIDYSIFRSAQFISVALDGANSTTVTVNGDGSDTVSEVENVLGSDGDDIIIGDAADNLLDGGDGADTLVGGAGADTLKGGDGFDTVDYSQESGINFVSVQLNGGNTVSTTVDGAADDTLQAIENVIGTEGNDTLLGGGSVNVLEGRGGDDFMRGGLSNDTLDGGAGINTISFSDSSIGITADMAITSGGFFTITHGSGEIDSAANFTVVIGSGGNDVISGDTADNRIEGLTGQDQLSGAAGNDTLIGGGNDDILDGGSGDDQLEGDDGDDTLSGGDGDDVINAGTGEDVILAGNGADVIDGGDEDDLLDYSAHAGANSISVTLSENTPATVSVAGSTDDTVVNVEQIVGTAGADTLNGDANDNTFWGEAGDDVLAGGLGTNLVYGGSGNDTFFGTAGQNTYYGGADVDSVDYSSTAGITSLSVALDGASLTVASIAGATNDLLAEIENVTATAGDDTVEGDDLDNHLQTLAGNDELSGGAGDDILDGGDDIDTVTYEAAASGVVVDLANNESTNDGDGGTDSYVDIENIIGSDFDDSITGDAFANVLSGNSGDDTFVGGSGVDTIDGGDDTDTIDYSTQLGVTSVSVTLAGSSSVTVTVTGDDNDSIRSIENITGSGGNDTLFGDTLNNHLQGMGGDDVLAGNLGDDILDGGTGNNTVTYADISRNVTADMSTAVDGLLGTRSSSSA